MTNNKFTVEARGEKFVVVKLYENEVDFSLYVLPHNKNLRGFFMTRGNDGVWGIFSRMLVSREVLQIENELTNAIVFHLDGCE